MLERWQGPPETSKTVWKCVKVSLFMKFDRHKKKKQSAKIFLFWFLPQRRHRAPLRSVKKKKSPSRFSDKQRESKVPVIPCCCRPICRSPSEAPRHLCALTASRSRESVAGRQLCDRSLHLPSDGTSEEVWSLSCSSSRCVPDPPLAPPTGGFKRWRIFIHVQSDVSHIKKRGSVV